MTGRNPYKIDLQSSAGWLPSPASFHCADAESESSHLGARGMGTVGARGCTARVVWLHAKGGRRAALQGDAVRRLHDARAGTRLHAKQRRWLAWQHPTWLLAGIDGVGVVHGHLQGGPRQNAGTSVPFKKPCAPGSVQLAQAASKRQTALDLPPPLCSNIEGDARWLMVPVGIPSTRAEPLRVPCQRGASSAAQPSRRARADLKVAILPVVAVAASGRHAAVDVSLDDQNRAHRDAAGTYQRAPPPLLQRRAGGREGAAKRAS